MQIKSSTECSMGAFCSTFDMHIGITSLKSLFFCLLFKWLLKTGYTVFTLFSGAIFQRR